MAWPGGAWWGVAWQGVAARGAAGRGGALLAACLLWCGFAPQLQVNATIILWHAIAAFIIHHVLAHVRLSFSFIPFFDLLLFPLLFLSRLLPPSLLFPHREDAKRILHLDQTNFLILTPQCFFVPVPEVWPDGGPDQDRHAGRSGRGGRHSRAAQISSPEDHSFCFATVGVTGGSERPCGNTPVRWTGQGEARRGEARRNGDR